MDVEFIGMVQPRDYSITRANADEAPVDPRYLRRFAQTHEEADFDRVLIGVAAGHPEATQVAAFVAAHTERLGMLVAHRPGFVAPTVAATLFATLDQFAEGRIAMHVITGGVEADQRRGGDYLSKEDRYSRTAEFMEIVKRAWTSRDAFSFEGQHYRFEDFLGEVRTFQEPRIPLYFGGSSPAAYQVGSKHADVFALWGEPLAETADQIASIHEAAEAQGRTEPPRISVSFRVILGPTEELAWERAHRILDAAKAGTGSHEEGYRTGETPASAPENVGSQRLLAAAAKGELHDRALWTPIAAATGGFGSSTALVGTPETVAQALLDYVDIGVTTFLLRGFEPYNDAIDMGRYLIPLVREEAAQREGPRHADAASV
jgi:alkanesulfonate monooxygenase